MKLRALEIKGTMTKLSPPVRPIFVLTIVTLILGLNGLSRGTAFAENKIPAQQSVVAPTVPSTTSPTRTSSPTPKPVLTPMQSVPPFKSPDEIKLPPDAKVITKTVSEKDAGWSLTVESSLGIPELQAFFRKQFKDTGLNLIFNSSIGKSFSLMYDGWPDGKAFGVTCTGNNTGLRTCTIQLQGQE